MALISPYCNPIKNVSNWVRKAIGVGHKIDAPNLAC
jgi:hypothetical protein